MKEKKAKLAIMWRWKTVLGKENTHQLDSSHVKEWLVPKFQILIHNASKDWSTAPSLRSRNGLLLGLALPGSWDGDPTTQAHKAHSIDTPPSLSLDIAFACM